MNHGYFLTLTYSATYCLLLRSLGNVDEINARVISMDSVGNSACVHVGGMRTQQKIVKGKTSRHRYDTDFSYNSDTTTAGWERRYLEYLV